MKVSKFHEKSLMSGALTPVRAPARTVTVYVVFSDRFPPGMTVTVLLSDDHEAVHDMVGKNDNELLTEALFIGTLKEITMEVFIGLSGPCGKLETTTGMMNVLKFQVKSEVKGAFTPDRAPA